MKNIRSPSEANFTGNSGNSDGPQAVFGRSDFHDGEDFGFRNFRNFKKKMFIFKKFLARLEVLKRDTLRFQDILNFQTRQKFLEMSIFESGWS